MRIELVREICYKLAADHGFELNCDINIQRNDILALGKVRYVQELVFSPTPIAAEQWRTAEWKPVIKEILFSSHFLDNADDEDILNVVRHELAHAFVFLETGKRQGHNEKFRAMCLRLGTKLVGAENDCGILKYRVPFDQWALSLERSII